MLWAGTRHSRVSEERHAVVLRDIVPLALIHHPAPLTSPCHPDCANQESILKMRKVLVHRIPGSLRTL